MEIAGWEQRKDNLKEGGMILAVYVNILFLLVLFFSPLSFAGEYVLVEGKDREVCRAYVKNLNSFKSLPHAMVCERKLNPKFTDFKKPEWKELNAWENRELIWKMDRYLWNSRTEGAKEAFDRNKEKWLERLKEQIKSNEIKLSITCVDIDNNGKLDKVVRYDMGTCSDTDESSFARPLGYLLIVFNEDMTTINEHLSNFTRTFQLGIFIYKGRTYLDYWGGWLKFKDGGVRGFDSVMNTTGWTDLGADICVYSYKSKSKQKTKSR
jgi:hypothetical protein